MVIDQFDCVSIAKELEDKKRKEKRAFFWVGIVVVIVLVVSSYVLRQAQKSNSIWTLGLTYAVMAIASIIGLKTLDRYMMSTKESIEYGLCSSYSFLDKHEKSSDPSESNKSLDECIKRLRQLKGILQARAGGGKNSGFKFREEYNNFLVLIGFFIKEHLIKKIKKKEELSKRKAEIKEITHYIRNEKFGDGLQYIEMTFSIKLNRKSVLRGWWGNFITMEGRDEITTHAVLFIVLVILIVKYNLLSSGTTLIGAVGGVYILDRILKRYVKVLIDFINTQVEKLSKK